MRFIEKDIKLQLHIKEQEQKFVQKIYTEITCDRKTEIHELEKKTQLTSKVFSNNALLVTLETEVAKMKLPSVYTKQQNIKEQINSCINKVSLKFNFHGGMIAIINHEEIISKWNTVREKLEKTYTGKVIAPYFNGVDKKIKNHDLLLNDFNQYRLFGLFYNNLYKNEHSTSLFKKNVRNRKIENMVYQIPLNIKEQLKLDKIENENALITFKGTLDAEQQVDEINSLFKEKGIVSKKGIQLNKYDGKYNVDIETGLLQAVNLNIDTSYGNEYRKYQEYDITRTNT